MVVGCFDIKCQGFYMYIYSLSLSEMESYYHARLCVRAKLLFINHRLFVLCLDAIAIVLSNIEELCARSNMPSYICLIEQYESV